MDVVDDTAHRIDFNLQQFPPYRPVFGNFRRQLVKVGVAVLGEQVAGRAYAARFARRSGLFAQQRLGGMAGERGFTGVFLTGKQPCVGQVVPEGGDLLPLGLMPRVNHADEAA